MSRASNAFRTVRAGVSTLESYLVTVATWLLVLGAAITWVAVWGVTMRLHLVQGNPVPAAVTAVVFFGIPLGYLTWRGLDRAGVDVDLPDVVPSTPSRS